MSPSRVLIASFAAGLAAASHHVQALEVLATSPVGSALNQSVHTTISVTFDGPVRPQSITDDNRRFFAYGRWSGHATGTLTFSHADQTVTLTPDEPFFAGETVFVVLSNAVTGVDGVPLRSAGYSFTFWTHARRAPMAFNTIGVMSSRDASGQHTQAYGGIASDLNNDGWSDVTIVNEITADLRVFLNRADDSGLFQPFIQPTFPVGNRASPSEPADFNEDGEVDICVANIDDDTVSVLFGNGDGTFTPSQTIPVGNAPRGITVLDFDGDGDLDVANTNANSSQMSLMTNLGNGLFAAPVFFEGGGSGEWSLAAADMNKDGIMDLVVGARGSQRMIVQLGNGDGTFSLASSTFCGGQTWMIALGDVNGDGFDDVATANSFTNNGAIMLGDGAGGLGAAQTYPVGAFPLATDLGDLDGDGDLDWTTSSFSAGEWQVFTNDSTGVYTTLEVVQAPAAGSCTLVHDFDNDGDNDLSFIDEIADVVVLRENSGKAVFGDFDGDGRVDLSDFAQFLVCVDLAPIPPDCEVFDADGDQNVDFADFVLFQITFTGP